MKFKKKAHFDPVAAIAAAASGAVGNVLMDQLDTRIDFFKGNAYASPLVIAALGLAGLYFAPGKKADAAYYGLLGASGAELGKPLAGMLHGTIDSLLNGPKEELPMNGTETQIPF